MKPNREPALLSGATVAAVLAILVAYGVLDHRRAETWEALLLILLPLAQGWFTRRHVVPVAEVEAAGLNPDDLHAPRKPH